MPLCFMSVYPGCSQDFRIGVLFLSKCLDEPKKGNCTKHFKIWCSLCFPRFNTTPNPSLTTQLFWTNLRTGPGLKRKGTGPGLLHTPMLYVVSQNLVQLYVIKDLQTICRTWGLNHDPGYCKLWLQGDLYLKLPKQGNVVSYRTMVCPYLKPWIEKFRWYNIKLLGNGSKLT